MPAIADLGASQLLCLFRRRELSPLEVTRAVLNRIETLDPLLNAFAARNEEAALDMARRSETRWLAGEPLSPLDGIPVAIKDLVLTSDLPTGRGSKALPPDPGSLDAPIAARLREGGAVIVGKTTVSELAWKGVGDCPATGITRNPWNLSRTPGASSAGSAAAVAAGLAVLATGSDGGGSIRIPASFTGIYGLKPTYGLVPSWPPSPVGTLSHLGPLARSVTDAALMLNVIARPDRRDWTALPYEKRDFTVGLDQPLWGRRIAFSPTFGYARVLPEVAALVEQAVSVFEDLGARVERVESVFSEPMAIYRPLFLAAYAHLTRSWTEEQLCLLDPGLREVVEAGRNIDIHAFQDAIFSRDRFAIEAQQFFERYDLLLSPTVPIPALPVGQDTLEPTESVPNWLDWNPFTYPFNLTQQPAASVPCGFLEDGLPVGLQIVAAKHGDGLVLNASRVFESARPFRMPDPAEIPAGSRN